MDRKIDIHDGARTFSALGQDRLRDLAPIGLAPDVGHTLQTAITTDGNIVQYFMVRQIEGN